MPTPVKLASEAAAKEKRVKAIDTFTFLDDGDVVKVYIELNGPLIDVKIGDVTAEYEERYMLRENTQLEAMIPLHRASPP